MAGAVEAMESIETPDADVERLLGFRFLKQVRKLLAHLHEHRDCHNRKVHYDDYAVLVLFYFFNATITSLRSLRRLTDFDKVRRKLGVRRTSRDLSDEARAAGVRFDRVVRLGGKVSGAKLSQPVRMVKVVVRNDPTRALRFRRKRVSSKKTFRTSSQTHELLFVTDRLELTAELIALLYKYRWQVELFFKWLKCVLGCRHLVAESENGVKIQIYAALIASLLIVLWTGRKPTKRTYETLQLYFVGWVSEEELDEHLAELKKV